MKNLSLFLTACCVCMCVSCSSEQVKKSVTIQGKVQFVEEGFKVKVYQRDGQSQNVLAETDVNEDHTYSLTVPVETPGSAIVDCGRWQSVTVWLEDENLDIDFRGKDTAKIKIKNPPYVYIKGGKNNELMNWINFESYRNYQSMIAVSQNVYRADIKDAKVKQDLSMALYGQGSDNLDAHYEFYAKHYSDRNSILTILSGISDKELVESVLDNLEKQSAVSAELVASYRQAEAEKKARRERMEVGKPAPNFEFQDVEGKTVTLDQYKGKVLVLDFWASWCGPCRKEIPTMKGIYEEFKGKGVEFLSVSIDSKKEAWEKALAEEAMPWIQGWTPDAGKSVMETYQFGGIPFILLIDKDGNIYRKHLRGESTKSAIQDALSGKPAVAPKGIGVAVMGAAM